MHRGKLIIYNNYTYTGSQWERMSKLYYYRTRYYDNQTGRFTSVDPILREIKNKTKTYFSSLFSSVCSCCGSVSSYPSEVPLGEEVIPQMNAPEPASFLSPYVYVENNAINTTDPRGEGEFWECYKNYTKCLINVWKSTIKCVGEILDPPLKGEIICVTGCALRCIIFNLDYPACFTPCALACTGCVTIYTIQKVATKCISPDRDKWKKCYKDFQKCRSIIGN